MDLCHGIQCREMMRDISSPLTMPSFGIPKLNGPHKTMERKESRAIFIDGLLRHMKTMSAKTAASISFSPTRLIDKILLLLLLPSCGQWPRLCSMKSRSRAVLRHTCVAASKTKVQCFHKYCRKYIFPFDNISNNPTRLATDMDTWP